MVSEEFADHGRIEAEIRELDSFLIHLDWRRTEFIRLRNSLIPFLDKTELDALNAFVDTLTNTGLSVVLTISILQQLKEKF